MLYPRNIRLQASRLLKQLQQVASWPKYRPKGTSQARMHCNARMDQGGQAWKPTNFEELALCVSGQHGPTQDCVHVHQTPLQLNQWVRLHADTQRRVHPPTGEKISTLLRHKLLLLHGCQRRKASWHGNKGHVYISRATPALSALQKRACCCRRCVFNAGDARPEQTCPSSVTLVIHGCGRSQAAAFSNHVHTRRASPAQKLHHAEKQARP